MGKTQSKDQVIIAQGGSSTSEVENQLSRLSITQIAVLTIFGIIIIYFMYTKCNARTKRWIGKQMLNAAPAQEQINSISRAVPMSNVVIT